MKWLKELKQSPSPLMLGILIAMIAAVSLSASDLYLPSLPNVAHTFHVTPGMTQLTISIFLLSAGLSQLFYGILSDRFGRRPILITGYCIFIIGSVLCTLAPSIDLLLAGRFIQGIGIGAGMSLTRVLVRDCFDGTMMAKAASYLGTVIAFAPAAAPALGGYLQQAFGFRANFAAMLITGCIVFLVFFLLLPETNRYRTPQATQIRTILVNLRRLFSSRVFISHVICAGLAFSTLIAYTAINPFLFENLLGFSAAAYGGLTFLMATGLVMGMFINSRLVERYGSQTMLQRGLLLLLAAGLVMGGVGLLGYFNAVVIIIPILLATTGLGLIFPNALTGALMPFATIAGLAGSVYGATQMLVSTVTSVIVASLTEHNQLKLALILIVLASIGIITLWLLVPRKGQ